AASLHDLSRRCNRGRSSAAGGGIWTGCGASRLEGRQGSGSYCRKGCPEVWGEGGGGFFAVGVAEEPRGLVAHRRGDHRPRARLHGHQAIHHGRLRQPTSGRPSNSQSDSGARMREWLELARKAVEDLAAIRRMLEELREKGSAK